MGYIRCTIFYIIVLLSFISCKKISDSNDVIYRSECNEIKNNYYYLTDFNEFVHVNKGDTIKYSHYLDTIKFVVKDSTNGFYYYDHGDFSDNSSCTNDFCEYKAKYIESIDKIWRISFLLCNFNIRKELAISVYRKVSNTYIPLSGVVIMLPINKENDKSYKESITIDNRTFYDVIYIENELIYNKLEGLIAIKYGSITYLKN